MSKQKLITFLEAMAYLILAHSAASLFFAFNKYSWMLAPEDSICSIPHPSGEDRIWQSAIAAFFLLTPLIVILTRKAFIRNVFGFALYTAALIIALIDGWWLFWGRYLFC